MCRLGLWPAGKLEVIRALCRELGVRTEPAKLGGVWIAPIYSWYHASFDREPDVPGAPAVEKVPCLPRQACGPHLRASLAPYHLRVMRMPTQAMRQAMMPYADDVFHLLGCLQWGQCPD